MSGKLRVSTFAISIDGNAGAEDARQLSAFTLGLPLVSTAWGEK